MSHNIIGSEYLVPHTWNGEVATPQPTLKQEPIKMTKEEWERARTKCENIKLMMEVLNG